MLCFVSCEKANFDGICCIKTDIKSSCPGIKVSSEQKAPTFASTLLAAMVQ